LRPREELETVASEVAACTDCKLHMSRKKAVPGEGPADTELMFIGEGPGFHENEQGRPFVGAAGQFLEELLAGIGLQRNQVFICNVVKCRPPGNRDPLPEEIQACSKYLDRQIRAINPKVIATLGRYSMAKFYPEGRIGQMHGQARLMEGRVVMAMYHPAAALHQPSLRRVVEEDFARLPEILKHVEKLPEAEEPPESPQQLSLF